VQQKRPDYTDATNPEKSAHLRFAPHSRTAPSAGNKDRLSAIVVPVPAALSLLNDKAANEAVVHTPSDGWVLWSDLDRSKPFVAD
jgi:hypothetical protein